MRSGSYTATKDTWQNYPCVVLPDSEDYPAIYIEGRYVKLSRFLFRILHGHWPVAFACHHCDNKKCIQPRHIFDSTAAGNNKDFRQKGGRSHTMVYSGLSRSILVHNIYG